MSNQKAIFIYLLVAFFLFFEMAVQVSPSVMTTELMRDLNLSIVSLGLMSGFYYYTYAAMQIPAGMLFDHFNVKYVMTIPILICTVGLYLFGHAHSMWGASIARLLMGLGSAFAFIAVLVVASDIFNKRLFALMAGITQALAAIGAMCGELVLSRFLRIVEWRQAMGILAAIGFILAILIFVFVRYKKTTPHSSAKINLWHGLKNILFKNQTWWIALYACLLWAPMTAFASLWGTPYLVTMYHLPPHTAATLCSITWLGLAIASPFLGWWSDHIKSRMIPLLSAALIGLVSCFIIVSGVFTSISMLTIALFFIGAACSGQALTFAVIKDNHSTQDLASAIGFNNMAVVISGAVFQPLVGKIIEWHQQSAGNLEVGGVDYQFGLSIIVGCFLLGAVVSFFKIKETLNRRKIETVP